MLLSKRDTRSLSAAWLVVSACFAIVLAYQVGRVDSEQRDFIEHEVEFRAEHEVWCRELFSHSRTIRLSPIVYSVKIHYG